MRLADEAQSSHQPLHERRRRDDCGLTTLEWLLIVAAVAGLAALAVVLVTNVVRDTSEDISGQNARLTAAQIQAEDITAKARATTATAVTGRTVDQHALSLSNDYRSDCKEILVLYGDVEKIMAIWNIDITASTPPTMDSASTAFIGTVWNASSKVFGCRVFTS